MKVITSKNLTLIYSNELFVGTTKRIQVFSPLMYCKQVQLDEDEFIEEQGKIIINTTSKIINVWDFYRVPPSQVRICVDKYLGHLDDSVANTGICFENRGYAVPSVPFINLNDIFHSHSYDSQCGNL